MPIESKTFLTAPINASSAGNNIVIPAVIGVGYKIWKLWLISAGTVNVTYVDGTNALSGPVGLFLSTPQTLPYDGTAYFSTSPGNAFIMNLSAPVQVSGTVYYTRG
jgi:hypothetical protein